MRSLSYGFRRFILFRIYNMLMLDSIISVCDPHIKWQSATTIMIAVAVFGVAAVAIYFFPYPFQKVINFEPKKRTLANN